MVCHDFVTFFIVTGEILNKLFMKHVCYSAKQNAQNLFTFIYIPHIFEQQRMYFIIGAELTSKVTYICKNKNSKLEQSFSTFERIFFDTVMKNRIIHVQITSTIARFIHLSSFKKNARLDNLFHYVNLLFAHFFLISTINTPPYDLIILELKYNSAYFYTYKHVTRQCEKLMQIS